MYFLKRSKYLGTILLFFVCTLLWLWNEKQNYTIAKEQGELSLLVGLTPIERSLFFDYPKSLACLEEMILKHSLRSTEEVESLSLKERRKWNQLQKIPMWRGLSPLLLNWYKTGDFAFQDPLMEKIQEGQVWRFFTPCLLHKDLFHFLFNMSWLWILGCQIEDRIGLFRFFLVTVLIGMFSNTAQYLMGGPFFLGFSGIVAGFVGFIWMRQKRAPKEGYPLPRPAVLFLFYCILAMMFVEAIIYILQMAFPFTTSFNIANTAHIIGGATGLVLGRIDLFARR